MDEDYYQVLNLPRNATVKQIRQRFLELTRERHPDRFPDADKPQAEIEFQRVTQAYNVLYDPARRREHDQQLVGRSQPSAADIATQSAKVYLQRGVDAYKKKRYNEAMGHFERAVEENPQEALAWYYIAVACRQRASLLAKGLGAAKKACDLEPMNVKYLKLAGELAARSGMTTRAAKYYHDAMTFGGEDPEIRQALKNLKRSAE